MGNYYGLLVGFVLGVGAGFEFPLVVVLLVWLGILSTAFLRKYRRHAIILILIIAAIVTPTPEPSLQLLFAAPLYALYELAIIVSAWVERHRERSGGVALAGLLALMARRGPAFEGIGHGQRA